MITHENIHISIRPMRESDIDKILNNFAEQNWYKPRDVLEKYFIRQNNKELYVFIADCNNDVAGYTVLYLSAENGAFKGKNIPEISDFIVFAKYQRRGIGNKILDEAEKKAAELSDRVCLGVGLHYGYGSAQRIYAKRGFIPDGSGVWYNNIRLEQNVECKNDDDLVLYLSKELC